MRTTHAYTFGRFFWIKSWTKKKENHEIEMTKVPFHFFIHFFSSLLSFFFGKLILFHIRWYITFERASKSKAAEMIVRETSRKKKQQAYLYSHWQNGKKTTTSTMMMMMATLMTKRIAVSSLNVLECEIPIKWAQTNWFVLDFYTPHLTLTFYFISFLLGCLLACSLSVIFYSALSQMLTVCTRWVCVRCFFFSFSFWALFVGAAAAAVGGFCFYLLRFLFPHSVVHSSAIGHETVFFICTIHFPHWFKRKRSKNTHTHTQRSDNGVYCFVGYLMQTRYTIEKLNTLKTFSSVSVIIANQQTNQAMQKRKMWTKEEPKLAEQETGKQERLR